MKREVKAKAYHKERANKARRNKNAERANKKRRNENGEVVETELDRVFRRQAKGLAVFNNVFGFWHDTDENYEPAWKKRRRS